MAKRGTKRVLEYARLAMGFANVRASRYGIRECLGGYSSTTAGGTPAAAPRAGSSRRCRTAPSLGVSWASFGLTSACLGSQDADVGSWFDALFEYARKAVSCTHIILILTSSSPHPHLILTNSQNPHLILTESS